MPGRPLLRLEDKLEGERALLEAMGRSAARRHAVLAGAVAAAALAFLAVLPRPVGASASAGGGVPTGSWTPVVRAMPAPPAAPAPAPPRVSTARREAPAASISLDLFRVPEPIPEPAPAPFPPSTAPAEPEILLGIPEPPPEPPREAVTDEPEVSTTPPRVAPGGKVPPQYPMAARSLRLSGWVRLEVQVDASGAVTATRVLETDRAGVGFEDAAARAVERWRFVPATRGAVPVPGTAVVRVEFQW